MRALGLALVVLAGTATAQDLPNANLPGNSPTLPNSNLPGPLPTNNPITLPNTDTSQAVQVPFLDRLFQPGTNVPDRNPTIPPTPPEEAAATDRQIGELQREVESSRAETAAARAEADEARQEASAAREAAAAAQAEAAAWKDAAARAQQRGEPNATASPPE
jgi:hypothetical protein